MFWVRLETLAKWPVYSIWVEQGGLGVEHRRCQEFAIVGDALNIVLIVQYVVVGAGVYSCLAFFAGPTADMGSIAGPTADMGRIAGPTAAKGSNCTMLRGPARDRTKQNSSFQRWSATPLVRTSASAGILAHGIRARRGSPLSSPSVYHSRGPCRSSIHSLAQIPKVYKDKMSNHT